jgi:hypothetical protein
MPTDRWLARKQKERHQRVAQLERVLLRINVHGPSSMHEPEAAPFVRWTRRYWQDAYQQIMAASREEWLCREAEAAHPPEHSPRCVCWDCVLRLHSDAARHQAELAVKREGKSPW